MNTPSSDPPRKTTPPPLSLQSVILLLSDPARWLIIDALADGEPRMINELAKEVGKHESTLLKAQRAAELSSTERGPWRTV
jgi:predicted transcriptional regulator